MSRSGRTEDADLEVDDAGEFLPPYRRIWDRLQPAEPAKYQGTRWILLRGLGLIYLTGFAIVVRQWKPLLGADGLLPTTRLIRLIRADSESGLEAFGRLPSLFWMHYSDGFALALGWIGIALALAVLAGRANAVIMALLWALYTTFLNLGQTFYGYGWEVLLLEAGFLGIFLAPALRLDGIAEVRAPTAVIWLFRWLTFRLMFGAGLIKLRGDPCWDDFTCLQYHYETQPNPHPLSWYFHHLPDWMHTVGVGFNHFVELVVPFLVFGPRPVRHFAGAMVVAFQSTLILSGNLSFLNWLTLVIALSCFDDTLWRRVLWWRRARDADIADAPRSQRWASGLLVIAVAVLSVNPMLNLMQPNQAMNASFDRLHLVNTYGAFGSVDRELRVLVIEGTHDAVPDEAAEWQEYVLPCAPGPIDRSPCLVTPYHLRLDWQMWFAPRYYPEEQPWLIHLVYKLLRGDRSVDPLFAENPFEAEPPRWVRIQAYVYRFTDRRRDGWWERELLGTYIEPISAENQSVTRYLEDLGFEL